MSTHEQHTPTVPTSAVWNTGGRSGPQRLEEPTLDEVLRELYDKNYHQLLPLIAEKMQKEKEQQDKLNAVKARLLYVTPPKFRTTQRNGNIGSADVLLDVRAFFVPSCDVARNCLFPISTCSIFFGREVFSASVVVDLSGTDNPHLDYFWSQALGAWEEVRLRGRWSECCVGYATGEGKGWGRSWVKGWTWGKVSQTVRVRSVEGLGCVEMVKWVVRWSLSCVIVGGGSGSGGMVVGGEGYRVGVGEVIGVYGQGDRRTEGEILTRTGKEDGNDRGYRACGGREGELGRGERDNSQWMAKDPIEKRFEKESPPHGFIISFTPTFGEVGSSAIAKEKYQLLSNVENQYPGRT
ncbi:hypothetical protein Tco_0019664 [Tanacetum coccineum]